MIERIRVECPHCGGTGKFDTGEEAVSDECYLCQGSGQIWALPEEKEFDKYEDD